MIWGGTKVLPEKSFGFSVQIQVISKNKKVFIDIETVFLSKLK